MAWQDRGMARAAVIGAGAGGLAAAVALQRRGWDVTVLERASELQAAGADLDDPLAEWLRNTGMSLAGHLGPDLILRQMDPILTWRPPT
jgi:2-polyprenyl-6-methoxyphenol hydroxylase-like FAD-dependent oxidoreductase